IFGIILAMAKSIWKCSLIILLTALVWSHAAAQDQSSPIITAENVRNLGSVLTLEFSEVEALGLTPGSGVFVINADASRIVTFASELDESPLSTAVVWDGYSGVIRNSFYIGQNQYDRMLEGRTLVVGKQGGIATYDLSAGTEHAALATGAVPMLGVWQSEADVVCGETAPEPDRPAQVVCSDNREPQPLFDATSDNFARIGRVPLPLAVTVTQDGITRVWNVEIGDILAEADAGGLAFFGAVNINGSPIDAESASYLAWRDPDSTTLNLLDFATGENKLVAVLDGDYITHLRLSRAGDVIFGIDPMSARRAVSVWLSESGEKIDLGQYRMCARSQPDLAVISYDGTALVIGCDSGIDVWRIMSDN
ncbi:MAG TPA: hypothetical protein VJZ27_15890, partial [Aggregatilineales bacterium]|nr:hypothetical protein [Aggregatilineales bacterium]